MEKDKQNCGLFNLDVTIHSYQQWPVVNAQKCKTMLGKKRHIIITPLQGLPFGPNNSIT